LEAILRQGSCGSASRLSNFRRRIKILSGSTARNLRENYTRGIRLLLLQAATFDKRFPVVRRFPRPTLRPRRDLCRPPERPKEFRLARPRARRVRQSGPQAMLRAHVSTTSPDRDRRGGRGVRQNIGAEHQDSISPNNEMTLAAGVAPDRRKQRWTRGRPSV